MYYGSPLFLIFCTLTRSLPRHSSVAQLATFTPSIQDNLGLPCTRRPLTPAINTLLTIRYSSILSTCPNHLNTLRSSLLANYISIPTLLRIYSFLTLYPQSSITQHTFQLSPHSKPLIHSVYHIPVTISISCHLRTQVLN